MSSDDQEYTGEGVQRDEQVEDPIDAGTADSDATLQADEAETMNEDNIVEGRTRGAAQPKGTYTEPDEDSIGADSDGNPVDNS